ncbi:hypothetical protein PIB30_072351 [Stylosanthes scabra]|uniref:Uncharacterized protein n=1 Tax=Stylosanthes scabra TaxID=79078 RepID=A0ABU6TNR1_9FABA|nr:hypothetical protein [Stylosanthes scabra]
MSAKEKQVAQILERKKWIIEQARQQSTLRGSNTCTLTSSSMEFPLLPGSPTTHFPKVPITLFSSRTCISSAILCFSFSTPELDKNDFVSEVLLSQPPFGVPFCSHRYSLYSNLGVVSEAALYSSVNNDGCASSGPLELDSGAISPQNQIEPIVSDSYLDPVVSLAKLQRSKPRQRALELLNSAQQLKHRLGDDNNAGICSGTVTNFDGGSLLVKSLYSETFVAEKLLDGQEIVLSGAFPNGKIEDKSDVTFAKVHADLEGLVGQHPSCLGTRVTVVSPRAGMDVLDLGMPFGIVMSVLPKQLNFDHVEESSVKGI